MTRGKFEPDTATLNFTASGTITTLMQRFLENPDDAFLIEKINEVFTILCPLSLDYDLWECQNYYFRIGRKKAAGMQVLAGSGNADARQSDPAVRGTGMLYRGEIFMMRLGVAGWWSGPGKVSLKNPGIPV